MKIVLIAETFSKNMGYITNMLPRFLAQLGAEVHVITTELSPYHQIEDFKEIYSQFVEKNKSSFIGMERYDGYTLHILPHQKLMGYIRIRGMGSRLREISPDITYSMAAIGWIALEATLLKFFLGYKLFTGSHTTASVFPLAKRTRLKLDWIYIKSFFTRYILGRFSSLATTKCYAATSDCADVAIRFFGVQSTKIDVCPLGVDVDLFSLATSTDLLAHRDRVRIELGFNPREIVCIYTGRFSEEKNPLILGKAVAKLISEGHEYRALFIGNGPQADLLRGMPGCVVLPFTPVDNLPKFYRASDIGVWPTQESTSMLDAAACGLPLVVNNTLIATERINGNGLTYQLNDVDDMARVLLLYKKESLRKQHGDMGARKMIEEFSWKSLALRRFNDFEISLGK